MPLDKNDLEMIQGIIDKALENHLRPIKQDISQMKRDISLLANLNQLDEIRKEPRLRALYNHDQEEA